MPALHAEPALRPSRRGSRVMRSRGLWLSVLLLTSWPALQAERLPIKSYTTADGLAHIMVTRIVKDSRGFLWFCTAGGLSRFDGYAFTNFGVQQGLPHGLVNDFLETRSGDRWIATGSGLVRFNPSGTPASGVMRDTDAAAGNSMFTVILPDDEHRHARAMNVLLESRAGTIWVGSNRGLYRLDGDARHRSLQPVDIGLPGDVAEHREVVDLLEDRYGVLWIATSSGLYRRWPDGSAARYGVRDGFPDEFVSDLFEDRQGRLWVATRRNGFFRLATDASRRAPSVDLAFGEQDGLPARWVNELFESSDGRFWIATSAGLAEFFLQNGDGARFRTYGTTNGLGDRYVAALTEDLGGNLWLSSHQSGAMKIARVGVTTFGAQDGIEAIGAVFEDRAGNLCFKGTVLGEALLNDYKHESAAFRDMLVKHVSHHRFGCYDGQRFSWIAPEAVGNWGWVLEKVALQARTGEWWLGFVGLYRFPAVNRLSDIKSVRPTAVYGAADGLTAPQVFRLFEDSRGNIWVSTISTPTYGLARWDPRSNRMRDLEGAPGLPSLKDDGPRSFGEDAAGRVWIGFNGGLARYANDRFEFFTPHDGLPRGPIFDIHLDRSGRLWLASKDGGLVRVDHLDAERPTFVAYTTADGLSSNNIEVIVEDAAGQLYVGGGSGIDRFEPASGRIKHFGVGEGLPPGQLRAAFRDRHDVLWFGTSNGLARLVPAPDRPPAAPPILITGLRVTGVPRPVSALGEYEMSLNDLAPRDNQMQIDLVGLGFASADVLRYQYRLDGTDADWSAAAEQRTVTYASLSPGRHTFRVRAVNSDGLVSDRPASIAFTVLRPVWQRWWFVTLVGLAVGLAVHAMYRYRVARVLEMANVRTHIATDLHDDIGANLTRIALLTEVAKQTRTDASLTSIAHIARESVSAMSDIVWAINPKRETLLDLTRRMRQHAEEVFLLRDIALRFDAPGSADTLKLGMDVRRDLLLIFKEAVSNAARHSNCSAVDIDLRVTAAQLRLVVADNGDGFDVSRDSDGQGLASMKRRAERLGGTLEVTSAPGRGTTVTVNARL